MRDKHWWMWLVILCVLGVVGKYWPAMGDAAKGLAILVGFVFFVTGLEESIAAGVAKGIREGLQEADKRSGAKRF